MYSGIEDPQSAESVFTISRSKKSRLWQRGNMIRPVQVKNSAAPPRVRTFKQSPSRCPNCRVGTMEPGCTLLTCVVCLLLGPCFVPCFLQNQCPVCDYSGGGICC
ncbi:uncharacterized protein LOC125038687 [Penaeus chinensis]|uniref:uncharacterized protein LOC125038687 n=1 Tax=Penaeus chinensis TaxID=139456 RepID=UPI001FB7494D|nr:uncharacterized protein LOC125038687 [Penaeus chinensis]